MKHGKSNRNDGLFPAVGRHMSLWGLAYVVLIVLLLVTGIVYLYARQVVEAQSRMRFEESVSLVERAVERRTASYVDVLYADRAFFETSGTTDRDDWQRYVERLAEGDRYQGLQALGYARYVYVTSEDGTQESANVEFTGPLDRANEQLEGRDLLLRSEHRGAIEDAIESGEPRATRLVNVLSETEDQSRLSLRPGFFVYLPVYRADAPLGSAEERRQATEGVVFGAFGMGELLGGIFPGTANPGLDFEVYDGDEVSGESLLYDDDGVLRANDENYSPRYSGYTTLPVAGQEWSLYFFTLPGFDSRIEDTIPNLALACGIIVAFVLFLATYLLSASRLRAQSAKADLEEANQRLGEVNRELESFSYSVSHDLRAPLRSIEGFSQILLEDYEEEIDREGAGYLRRVRAASRRMSELIDDLLMLSRVTRAPLERALVNPGEVATEVMDDIRLEEPEREVEWRVHEIPDALCDARLLRALLENLIGNAWKFTSKTDEPRIEFGVFPPRSGSPTVYYVRDNGAGFDMKYADKLFGAFQRLHTEDEFEGTGIGLATVARIVHRHGGEVWAEGEVGGGATFSFTLDRRHYPRS